MSEFQIPGLKEAIKDVEKYRDAIDKAAKSTLELAINGEKAAKAASGSGLKQNVELTKTAKAETDKLEQAKEKLNKLQSAEAVELAKVNLLISDQIQKNKALAASESESATALQKFNAQLNDATKKAKDLGAQMVLLEQEGKKNTAEYKRVSDQFTANAKTAKELNDRYREISKTAGDNRALVGSYSDELKGHFDGIKGSFESLKSNLASNNIGGSFNAARTIITGFGQALKSSTKDAEGLNTGASKTGGIFANIKDKASSASKSMIEFFKPSEQNSNKMKEGLERVKIGFTQNAQAINEYKNKQAEANGVSLASNDINQKGGIISNLFAKGQMALSGATGIASGAFNILKVAIASTGIGLLIIAAVLLIDYFSKFRPLMNFLKDAMAGVGAVVEMLSQKIGQFVMSIKNFGDLMDKLGDIVAHPIDSMKSLGNEMAETAKKAYELSEATRKLTSMQKDYVIESKNVENQIRTLMLQAKNRTTSEEERVKLLEKAQHLEEEMHEKKISMWEEEMKNNLKGLLYAKKITDEEIALLEKGDQAALDHLKKNKNIQSGDIDDFREVMQKKADIDGEGIAVREKSQNMIDMLNDKAQKKREDAEKKAEEAAKKELERQKKSAEITISTMKITLDNIVASYDQQQHLDEENIAHINSISMMKIQIAKAEMEKNLIGIEKGSLDEIAIRKGAAQEIEKIEREKSTALNKVVLDRAKFELELYDINNKSVLEDAKTLTDLLVEEEKRRLKASLEVHKEHMRQELGIDKDTTDEKLKLYAKTGAQLSANELKYLQWLVKEESTTNKEIKKNDDALLNSKLKAIETEEKTEDRKYKLLNKGAYANAKYELQVEKDKLLKEKELYKNNAEKTAEIDLQLAENSQKLSKLVSDSKIKGFQDSLSGLIAFAGQESAVGKMAAISQTTINTYEGASRALKDYPAPYSYVVAGLTIANGLRSVAQIEGVQLFAEGTDFAPYTGKAIVDEEGAELHFDKHGKLKSLGSEGGARVTDIVKGDKIIPADISAIIRQTMFASYGMKNTQNMTFDYAEMGRYFDKSATKIVSAVTNKKESTITVNVQRNITDRVTFKGRTV